MTRNMLNKHRGHKHETARAEEIDDPQTYACFGLNCAAVQGRHRGRETEGTKEGREAGGSGLDLHSPEKLRTIAETALEVGR